MSEPLPLSDLLASLRDQGLPVGIREHLVVGRLLARWDDTEPSSLRGALGAVLARNPDEVRIVHATFDQLYGAPANETEPPPAPQESSRPARRKLRRGWIAGLIAAALALAVVLGALLWPRAIPDPIPLLPPARQIPITATPPPEIDDTISEKDWERSFTAAAGVATGLFLWLFGVRLRREARHRARREMVEAADALPGPHRYEISLEDLAPPVSRDLLDDAAGLLGRRTTVPPRHGDLDVERTLARTLRAGLAPLIVLRAQASTHPILVLEDVGDEMRPWRRRVSALLDGLETRGVPIDRWRFHADAGRVFRNPGEAPQSLKQLFRLRAESPLLVVSAGEGLLEGIEGRPAPWTEALRGWRHRAWLHPVTDPAYWRPALRALPIQAWPLTPAGVMAAARQIIHGETGRPEGDGARALPQRRVSPRDVERLRWLLTLAPWRDPGLAELLRQKFCPQVPPAALLEALEAPPLATWPGVGPTAEEVHTFLAALLAASEPKPGTAAHERWRLDRALQEIRIPGREEFAARELADLAQGPLAAEVVSRVEQWTGKQESRLRQRVLRQAFSQADREGEQRSGWRWTWPDLTEIAAALVCLGLLGAVLPSLSGGFKKETPVTLEKVYRLGLGYAPDSTLVARRIDVSAPQTAELYQDGRPSQTIDLSSGSASFKVEPGHWFDLRARAGEGRLAVSEAPVWVEPFFEPAPPVTEPKPRPGARRGNFDESNTDEATRQEILKRIDALEILLKQSPSSQSTDEDLSQLRAIRLYASVLNARDFGSTEQELAKLERKVAMRVAPLVPAAPIEQRQEDLRPRIDGVKPDSGSAGEEILLYFSGANFDSGTTVTFDPATGIYVVSCEAPAREQLNCQIQISGDAPSGPRTVIVINPDKQTQAYSGLFSILEPPTAN